MNDESGDRVTLRRIAEEAKVCRMTVSLALRDHPSIGVETRHRIRQIAERLGYHPDPIISQLMEKIRGRKQRHLAHTIAFVTAHPERDAWRREPGPVAVHGGIVQRAAQYGYQVDEFWLRERGMTGNRLSEIIRNRGIDGIIVPEFPAEPSLLGNFRWGDFSAVAVGYSLPCPSLHRASIHHHQCMLLLMRKLFESGYRRVGLAVPAVQDDRAQYHWRSAYMGARNLLGLDETIPHLLMPRMNPVDFSKWLKTQRPEVIITIGEYVGQWLRELGRRIPGDVALVNIDLRPTMIGTTGIHHNKALVGASAVDLLVSLMHNNERGVPEVPRVVMVEGVYIEGTTTEHKR